MAISYSNNGDYLMSAGKDRNIKLWNSGSGRLIKKYSGGNNYEINSIWISHDNSFFLSSGADSNIFLSDVSKGNVVTKMQGHKKKVSTLCWNYSDQLFISGSDDNLVKVWDTREKTSVDTLNASKDSIVKVESNSDQIVSGSVDGYLQIYDIRCGVVYLDYLND